MPVTGWSRGLEVASRPGSAPSAADPGQDGRDDVAGESEQRCDEPGAVRRNL